MTKLIKSDIYQALFPIYHISKLLGLLPTRFVRQRNNRYIGHIYIIDVIYSIFLLALFMALEVYGLWRDLKDGWEYSTRLKHRTAVNITIGDVLAVAILAGVGVLMAPFRWKYIQEMIVRFVDADYKLGFITPKKTCRFAILLTSCTMISFIMLASLDIYVWDTQTKMKRKMSDKGPINYSPIYLLYLQGIMIEIQCTVATFNLKERFIRLNKNLKDLSTKSIQNVYNTDISIIDKTIYASSTLAIPSLQSEIQTKRTTRRLFCTSKKPELTDQEDFVDYEITDVLSKLVKVHFSLCDINQLINSAFQLPILIVGITCLLHLIITPYFLLMEASSDKEKLFIADQCLWCLFHAFRMLLVVLPCHAVIKESRNTAILISQLLTYNWQQEIRKKLEIFSLQILQRPLVFTACGLFSLDRTLVTSMVGAVATYLVILIQFQNSNDANDATDILKKATSLLKNISALYNITDLKMH